MNREKLKTAEAFFLGRYPGGFANPEMLEMGKKHSMDKLVALAQDSFSPANFANAADVITTLGKLVSRSTMISLFEKPKFRDLLGMLSEAERDALAGALGEQLHGDQSRGFTEMVRILAGYKLAKWPLVTVALTYYRPHQEVFVKPTTTKDVIQFFQLDGLRYSPTPSYEFYAAYRDVINQMKQAVDSSLQVENAAFCAFLMMAMEIMKQ